MGPMAYPTARSYRFGVLREACPATARRLVDIASADGSRGDAPGGLRDGSLVTLRHIIGSRQARRHVGRLARTASTRLPFGGSF